MSIGTTIYTWLYGKIVGTDEIGNKYYTNSENHNDLKAKRWVIFKGEIEASKIPPHWHAWLHKSIDEPPINYSHKYKWQKKHQENLTGTIRAYKPDGSLASDSKKNMKKYESWKY